MEHITIHGYLWTLLATIPSPWCLQTQLTTPLHLLIHQLFTPHSDHFPAILHILKAGTLGTNNWMVRKPPDRTINLNIALITPACQ